MSSDGLDQFWRELLKIGLPVILGAALTFPATWVITSRQAALQKQQLILDRKITAIKEFSSVSFRGPAERVARIIGLKKSD